MDSRFITPLVLPLALISLFANPQTGSAERCKFNCTSTPTGGRPGSIIPVELQNIEKLIAQGQAKAADYLRAGEIYTQLGDKAMAETRFNQARGSYNKLGDRQGVMKVDQKQQMLNSPLQRQTTPEIQMPGQNQIQQGR
jgi:hypothetical protein